MGGELKALNMHDSRVCATVVVMLQMSEVGSYIPGAAERRLGFTFLIHIFESY